MVGRVLGERQRKRNLEILAVMNESRDSNIQVAPAADTEPGWHREFMRAERLTVTLLLPIFY